MEYFWNKGEHNKSQGLDILGIRRLDQAIEAELVSGITTISYRARYLSILPWFLNLFFEKVSITNADKQNFNNDLFEKALSRLEFIILMSSSLGDRRGESGNIYGVIGSDIYDNEITLLKQDKAVNLPDKNRRTILGTYSVLSRNIGLLNNPPVDSGLPAILSPRGKELSKIREHYSNSSHLINLIINGGQLTTSQLDDDGNYFSVNGLSLDISKKEKDYLESSFFQPFISDVERYYSKYIKTVCWALKSINSVKGRSAADILAETYRNAVSTDMELNDVELSWVEYELRRRAHFGLELILLAFTRSLLSIGQARLNEAIAYMSDVSQLPPKLTKITGIKDFQFGMKFRDFSMQLSTDAFLEGPVDKVFIRKNDAGIIAVFALSILESCRKQTIKLINTNKVKSRYKSDKSSARMEMVFNILENPNNKSTIVILAEILNRVVIEAHLTTTWRKMGSGQKCSLRFYPDGEILRPTGIDVLAGYSNTRLGNVLGILSDMGLCTRVNNNNFMPNERSEEILLKHNK